MEFLKTRSHRNWLVRNKVKNNSFSAPPFLLCWAQTSPWSDFPWDGIGRAQPKPLSHRSADAGTEGEHGSLELGRPDLNHRGGVFGY